MAHLAGSNQAVATKCQLFHWPNAAVDDYPQCKPVMKAPINHPCTIFPLIPLKEGEQWRRGGGVVHFLPFPSKTKNANDVRSIPVLFIGACLVFNIIWNLPGTGIFVAMYNWLFPQQLVQPKQQQRHQQASLFHLLPFEQLLANMLESPLVSMPWRWNRCLHVFGKVSTTN